MEHSSIIQGGRAGARRWLSPSSLALGAVMMYYLDPDKGRRRRALLHDQFVHAGRKLRRAQGVVARDFAGRAAGVRAAAARFIRGSAPPTDEVLRERVRAQLGRIVSHPHAVRVDVQDGHVVLSGTILQAEVAPLLKTVWRVPGVRSVEDRLDQYPEPGNIPALQGGVERPGHRFELLQDNWSPAARVVTGGVGAGLLAYGLRARHPAAFLFGLLGSALLVRAAANRDLRCVVGLDERHDAVEVQKTIHIDAPVPEVYAFWTDIGNFPRFMSHVREVTRLDEERTRWVVSGPAGVPVEWIARVTRRVPEQLIEWCADEGSTVRHRGVVRFDPEGQGTRVQVRLRYTPPAGLIGHVVATLLGADPKHEMDADFLRMKTMIETGRTSHDAVQRGAPPATQAANT
ncbi:MAG: SRPBCC family protein [Pseudomonadota bacterium]